MACAYEDLKAIWKFFRQGLSVEMTFSEKSAASAREGITRSNI